MKFGKVKLFRIKKINGNNGIGKIFTYRSVITSD